MNWIILFLCIGNLFLWGISGFEEPGENRAKLKEEIDNLEKEMPELEKTSEWTKRGQTALNEGPAENVKSYINRIQALSKVWKFSLEETAQTGEYPAYVSFSGVGSYKATADILREIGRNASVIVNKLSLFVQDDLLINAHFETMVRTGAWKGNSTSKERIEPLPEHYQPPNLGNVDLFGREVTPEKPVVGTPKIRYLGFYSGKGSTFGIIEENLKTMLVQPGDKTPTGLRVESLNPDFFLIRAEGERGKEWKIPLEKSR